MNGNFLSPNAGTRVRVKDGETFFAAGDSFEQASSLLSDGAFKLFAHLCMHADRRTGQYEVTLKQLATCLKKSRRIIGCYAVEVQVKGICKIDMGRNQFARTVFEICEDYWPYVRSGDSLSTDLEPVNEDAACRTVSQSSELKPDLDRVGYIKAVRNAFVTLGCTGGIFRSADKVIAQTFFERGIPLAVVTNALVMGAVRKYASWLNGKPSEAIASLKYFEAVVDELLENPLPLGYSEYVREKLKQLQGRWGDRVAAHSLPLKTGPRRKLVAQTSNQQPATTETR